LFVRVSEVWKSFSKTLYVRTPRWPTSLFVRKPYASRGNGFVNTFQLRFKRSRGSYETFDLKTISVRPNTKNLNNVHRETFTTISQRPRAQRWFFTFSTLFYRWPKINNRVYFGNLCIPRPHHVTLVTTASCRYTHIVIKTKTATRRFYKKQKTQTSRDNFTNATNSVGTFKEKEQPEDCLLYVFHELLDVWTIYRTAVRLYCNDIRRCHSSNN